MTQQNVPQWVKDANRRVEADRRRQFAKRASDAQMLERLTVAGRGLLHAASQGTKEQVAEAMKELAEAVTISERRKR